MADFGPKWGLGYTAAPTPSAPIATAVTREPAPEPPQPVPAPEPTQGRYRVVEGSQSAHCCFEATVVDTSLPLGGPSGRFESVCETFCREDADDIAEALNNALEVAPTAAQPALTGEQVEQVMACVDDYMHAYAEYRDEQEQSGVEEATARAWPAVAAERAALEALLRGIGSARVTDITGAQP